MQTFNVINWNRNVSLESNPDEAYSEIRCLLDKKKSVNIRFSVRRLLLIIDDSCTCNPTAPDNKKYRVE